MRDEAVSDGLGGADSHGREIYEWVRNDGGNGRTEGSKRSREDKKASQERMGE